MKNGEVPTMLPRLASNSWAQESSGLSLWNSCAYKMLGAVFTKKALLSGKRLSVV